MSNTENWTEHPNAEDAQIIATCIAELVTDSPSDDRFRVLEAISYHVANCFGDAGVSRSMFIEGIDDPAVFKPLLDNPAAGPLLAYMINALARFDFGEPDSSQTTAQRRAALSDAFALTGKKGERWLPMVTRMRLAAFFSEEMRRSLGGASWETEAQKKKATERAKRASLRATYLWHYKESFDSANDTHATRMAELREILRETPPQVDSIG